MGWLSTIKQKTNPQATELRQLQEELCRVSAKLESRERELAEALEQQTRHQRDPVGNRELSIDIRPVPSLSW